MILHRRMVGEGILHIPKGRVQIRFILVSYIGFVFFFCFLFWPRHVGSWFPDLRPLRWKCAVLTSGPPGKSRVCFLVDCFLSVSPLNTSFTIFAVYLYIVILFSEYFSKNRLSLFTQSLFLNHNIHQDHGYNELVIFF